MKNSLLLCSLLLVGALLCFNLGCSGSYYYGGSLSKITTSSSGIIDTASGVKKLYNTFPPSDLHRIIITSDSPPAKSQYIPVAKLWAEFEDFSEPSKDKLAQAMQIKAAQLGAEMVVDVKFTIYPLIRIGKASGLAIKLKR